MALFDLIMYPSPKGFDLMRKLVSSANFTEGPTSRPARTPLRWAVYVTAIGIATLGWIAFLAYYALSLLSFWLTL